VTEEQERRLDLFFFKAILFLILFSVLASVVGSVVGSAPLQPLLSSMHGGLRKTKF
jgi:hypothetical protein